MSWARTTVSTGITSPFTRCRATTITATPVTNMASVESMNGAPRIAPTPTPCDASDPPPVRIAMIGIIVSGKAVPTAASTDPTAPSASSSLRPNHSMPFVNSSAPNRITTNAATRIRRSTSALDDAEDDACRDHREDRDGDEGHVALGAPPVANERRGDTRRRRRDHEDQAEPDETGRLEAQQVREHPGRVQTGAHGPRSTAGPDQENEAHGKEGDRDVRPDGEEAADRSLQADLVGGGRHRRTGRAGERSPVIPSLVAASARQCRGGSPRTARGGS